MVSTFVLNPIQTLAPQYPDIRYVMAPMAGITDVVFRTLVRGLGADTVVSELVSAEGLIRGGQKTLDLCRISDEERPVGIQIFGHSIPSMAEAARIVEAMGVDFVDINFGCPVNKVVSDGAGAAWLKDPIGFGKLLTAVKAALNIPLTIKIRTGWDSCSINAMESVRIAADSGVSWVAIHGRTRAQGYEGLADWELIRRVAWESPIPIIGNGDILTSEQARSRLEQGYCHAVMIGRGALKNPWIFQELQSGATVDYRFMPIIERHMELALQYKDRRRAFLSLKKFMSWYASGLPGASQFRGKIFATMELPELRSHCEEFFGTLAQRPLETGQPFLMGGHG